MNESKGDVIVKGKIEPTGAYMPKLQSMGQSINHKQMDNEFPHPISAGTDRFNRNEMMIWGLLPLSIKLSAKDTGGQLMVFEHRNMGKGGPPRHVHFDQDEWFYIVTGEFEFEVADKRYRLRTGDTLFAPRQAPHGWANVGEEPGTLLTTVSPAGSFEEFILDTTKRQTVPPPDQLERAFSAHGMKVVGPPLIEI